MFMWIMAHWPFEGGFDSFSVPHEIACTWIDASRVAPSMLSVTLDARRKLPDR